MKNIWLYSLIITCLSACQAYSGKSVMQEQEEVIITGHIKNRDFYPNVDEIVLKLPFFKEGQISYTTPIDKNNEFYFNFQLHADMCEVVIAPYVEHLFVQSGDSIHVEIDFKDILNPIITGNGAEFNSQFTLFTEGGYYMKDYSIWNDFKNNKELDQLMEHEYQERLRRYDEFIAKHQPDDKVKEYINQLIKADYYSTLFELAIKAKNYRIEDVDIHQYTNKLQEASLLLDNQVITNAHFRLSQEIYAYLHYINKRLKANNQAITLEEILSPMKDTPAMPYLFARGLSLSLHNLNDTTYFDMQKVNFNQYIKTPYLRNSILQLQQSKKNYQENPKPISDYLLYGQSQDENNTKNIMSYMAPIYNILKKHQGKMIYLDFWTPWCRPCLAEMEPMKELRQKYDTKDIVFITIYGGNDKKRYEQILNQYEMHMQGIEHIFINKSLPYDQTNKMYNQLNVNMFPYYFIINREGVIVNYGTMMRPSYPGTGECIDKWLNN